MREGEWEGGRAGAGASACWPVEARAEAVGGARVAAVWAEATERVVERAEGTSVRSQRK